MEVALLMTLGPAQGIGAFDLRSCAVDIPNVVTNILTSTIIGAGLG